MCKTIAFLAITVITLFFSITYVNIYTKQSDFKVEQKQLEIDELNKNLDYYKNLIKK